MKVSAVIPTYNRREYIKRAVDSILAQTVPVDEIIVVDDELSTDNIESALNGWYGSQVRVVKQGGGLSGARRRGVQEAKGTWIAFLDSDDDWAPNRNRQLLEAVSMVPEDVAWIFGDLRVVTDSGEGITLFEEFGLSIDKSLRVFADSLAVQFPFQFGLLQGSFIRRSALLEFDCFNEGLQHSEDLLAGFQVASRYRFAAIPFVVGRYYRTSDLTANSAVIKGLQGRDYFRSRMLCFELVIKSGQKRPWNRHYADAVFGLCKVVGRQGHLPIRMAWQQFRFGAISPKRLAFFAAALLGQPGLRAWDKAAELRQRVRPQEEVVAKNGYHAALRAASRTER